MYAVGQVSLSGEPTVYVLFSLFLNKEAGLVFGISFP
jgi:hypothetical protein